MAISAGGEKGIGKRQMYTWISLLRGVNMTGHNRIKMTELAALYREIGFEEVQTYNDADGNCRNDKKTMSSDGRRKKLHLFSWPDESPCGTRCIVPHRDMVSSCRKREANSRAGHGSASDPIPVLARNSLLNLCSSAFSPLPRSIRFPIPAHPGEHWQTPW
jgi:hypothetical protein